MKHCRDARPAEGRNLHAAVWLIFALGHWYIGANLDAVLSFPNDASKSPPRMEREHVHARENVSLSNALFHKPAQDSAVVHEGHAVTRVAKRLCLHLSVS